MGKYRAARNPHVYLAIGTHPNRSRLLDPQSSCLMLLLAFLFGGGRRQLAKLVGFDFYLFKLDSYVIGTLNLHSEAEEGTLKS